MNLANHFVEVFVAHFCARIFQVLLYEEFLVGGVGAYFIRRDDEADNRQFTGSLARGVIVTQCATDKTVGMSLLNSNPYGESVRKITDKE